MQALGDFMSSNITIALFAYNSAGFISESLKSLLSIDSDFQYLIVDDCSQDGTHEIIVDFLEHLSETDRSRFSYHRNSINFGTVKQFLNAANLCKTEFIKPLDFADPLLTCDFSSVVDLFVKTNADVVFTRPVFLENNEIREDATIKNIMKNILLLPPRYRLCSLYSANNLVASTAFFRVDFVRRIVPFILSVRLIEDWPMWLYSSFLGSKLVYLDKPFVAYRIHQGQKEKSIEQIKVFESDFLQIEVLKNQLIPFGNRSWGRKYYNFKSKILNKILCRI
jgi:glycosyltransferase involved in cell wall biosynthesis